MMTKMETSFDPGKVEAAENLLIDFQFLLQERMAHKGLSQSDLADLAGISKARLSQILSDDANPTVETIAELFYALGERVFVSASSSTDEVGNIMPKGRLIPAQKWRWVEPERLMEPISDEMVAIMKNSTLSQGAAASNDNYTFGEESEVAGALLEPEAA